MQEIISTFKQYLNAECHFAPDLVEQYIERVPQFLAAQKISSPSQISARQVAEEWRRQRWQITDTGIVSAESAKADYLLALKEFLHFLERKKFTSEQKLSEIINIRPNRKPRVKPLSGSEKKRLDKFLFYHVASDQQRKASALVSLMLHSGLTLRETLNLRIADNGSLTAAENSLFSGDFYMDGDQLFIKCEDLTGEEKSIAIHSAARILLSFYLENRPQKSVCLFTNSSRKNPQQLSFTQARKLIEQVLSRASIPFRSGLAEEVLVATANSLPRQQHADLPKNVIRMAARPDAKEPVGGSGINRKIA